ncbi:hypothetical protein FRC01_009234 [Tulasnella sp. 417]|nr:hypothetical protein FRC01_009234 [Tulasnella sp. 417]
MTIMTMFYTRVESTQRISWTFMCTGIAAIIASFTSFGVAHTNATARPHRWQWFMIIVSILSVVLSTLYFWRMPDNPATARFLNEQEKVNVVKRIRINQNGIEAKVWKRYQFIEALTDPKTWLFFLFSGVSSLVRGTGLVFNLIIKQFGYNTLQTTALSIPIGVASVTAITIGTIAIKYFPNSRSILGMFGFLPGFISSFVLIFLPWEDKTGLLIAFYLIFTYSLGFAMILSLVAVVFAGQTKKMTCNAIFLVKWRPPNSGKKSTVLATPFRGPSSWYARFLSTLRSPTKLSHAGPRHHQQAGFACDILIISVIRWYLVRENKRRGAEKLASGEEYEEFGFVEHVQDDGSVVKLKVPIQVLDITDLENKGFRYPL